MQGQKAAWNVADGSQVSTHVFNALTKEKGVLRHSKPDGKRKTAEQECGKGVDAGFPKSSA